MKKLALFRKITSVFILVVFIATSILPIPLAQAQGVLNLPVPGTMVMPTPSFAPIMLDGMIINPDNPLKFDFIINEGDTLFSEQKIQKETEKLIKYFLASMTIPKEDLWVNLSPYEKNRIIPDELGKTELGRDMLAQDYILKQLTASLVYPEDELGKKFWNKVYRKAKEKYGTTDIPIDTFNKVWILPEKAVVYEYENTVFIIESRLKVMLDEDYVAMDNNTKDNESSSVSSEIIREIILPEIEREVNQGKNFAPLRQIYNSLILAKWYREKVKESLFSKVYIDQNKIKGIDIDDSTIKDQIYDRYMAAYKKGVYDYIKEDYDQLSKQSIPRKYFSGGEELGADKIVLQRGAGDSIRDGARRRKLEVELKPEAGSQKKGGNKATGSNEPASDDKDAVDSVTDIFEFKEEGFDIALNIFHSAGDAAALVDKLSEVEGVGRVTWHDGVLTIISKTEVVKIHSKEQEINERHGLKDRFYIKHCVACAELAVKIYHRDSRDETKKRDKPVYVLGVLRYGHDSGAALIKDGVLIGAIEEERLNLDKHTYKYFPKEASRYLLEANGITWEDIDHVAVTFDYNFFRETPHSREPHYDYRQKNGLPFKQSYLRYDTDKFQSFLEEMAIDYGTGYIPPVTFVKHHKAHAAAAYYSSGFSEPTLVVSIDGQGEDESTTIWLAKDEKLKKIGRTSPATHSLGHFYHLVTMYLGYQRHDEGKVMGYAPYGAPQNSKEEKTVSQLREMMKELIWFDRETRQVEINKEDFVLSTVEGFPAIDFSESFLQRLTEVYPLMPEGKTGRDLRPEDRVRAHLAFTMQERVEEVIRDMVSYYLKEYEETRGIEHVVLVGGLALNIASNGKLIENGTVDADKFFVPAYPADDGTAVGAALSVAREEYGLDVLNETREVSFGKTYSDEEIQEALDRFGLVEGVDYEKIPDDEQLVDEVASAIVNDKTVAWFQGGAELGPRALGNRSILNRLNDPEGNLKVNRIKNREPWRPSALSIQEERAAEFLDGIRTSPFMTISFPVAESKKEIIRAGAHPGDGTTRPQTVSREENPLYWSLLGEMGERTGVPGVLNTSFNRRGPIVETPEDALNTYFYGEGLDFLSIGHFFVRRKDKIAPSILNGSDEDQLKDIFVSEKYKSEPLTKEWNEFWEEANNLAALRKSDNQHYLIVTVVDDGGSWEVLRVPLVKEMFQERTRKYMIADLSSRIQRGIGKDAPTTIAIETTAPQYREVVIDLFKDFAPDGVKENWDIVELGFGERSPPKERTQQKRVNPFEAAESLNASIRKWQKGQRDRPVLIAVTGSNVGARKTLVGQLQGSLYVIDAGRWDLDESERNDSFAYPFSHMKFNDYVHALERLQRGQTAMIPLHQVVSEGLPPRGFTILKGEEREQYKAFLTKENSRVWVSHDGRLFEEVRPEATDIFAVNTPVVLSYPILRNLFKESYFVATPEDLKMLSTGREDNLLSRFQGIEFADIIVELEANSKKVLKSWFPLRTPQRIKKFFSLCIALTNFCPVGCAFCFMHSVKNKARKISLNSEAIGRILAYVKEHNIPRLLLSGGEPTTEMPNLLRIIREADVESIVIFSSGYYGGNIVYTRGIFNDIEEAVRERTRKGKKPLDILFEISVDEFHMKSVPMKNIINIIKLFENNGKEQYPHITLELKGILSDNDPIPEIVKSLNGTLTELENFENYPGYSIKLPSGFKFLARYSEVKLMEEMLDTELDDIEFHRGLDKRINEGGLLVDALEKGINFSVNYDGAASVHDYLAKDLVLGNTNNDQFAEDINMRLTRDPLVVALRQYGIKTIFDIATELRPNFMERVLKSNNHFLAISDILRDEELREYVYKKLIQLIEGREARVMLGEDVFVIGSGRIVLGGPVTAKGNKSQIRFQGEDQENLSIDIGKGLIVEDGFISLRRTQGPAVVEHIGDTLVIEEMSVGDNVKIIKGGEIMNVPFVGDDVEINGSFLIEMDEGGIGDRSKFLGNSIGRMSVIGSDVVVDEQSKIFKSVVFSEAKILNASLIGGQDEHIGGWRHKDDEGKGRGVIIGRGAEFRNGLAQHKGVQEGKMNPITVADGVKLDGVFLISERNKGIHVATDLELSKNQRVYIYDGVTVDEGVRDRIQKKLVTSDIIQVTSQNGNINVEGVSGSLAAHNLLNVPELKKKYAAEKTRGIPKVYSIDTIKEAQGLNDLLQKSDVFISRAGEVITSRDGRDDIVIRIGQGTFVYPGVEIYAKDGRTLDINVWDLGNRGGTIIIADKKD